MKDSSERSREKVNPASSAAIWMSGGRLNPRWLPRPGRRGFLRAPAWAPLTMPINRLPAII
jgi:hypothetical protein